MKLNIYMVHDQKANAYLPPFFLPEDGMAHRTFGDCCNDVEHQFGKHPEDYTLFKLGEFDDLVGQIKSDTKISLGNGIEYLFRELTGQSEGSDFMKTDSYAGIMSVPDKKEAKS